VEQSQITTLGFLVNNTPQERATLSSRLKSALISKGIRPSPTIVSRGFNEFAGQDITPHTARNWLLGKSFPNHEKLVAIGKWLQVSPAELRYGREVGKTMMFGTSTGEIEISELDRSMIERYLKLPLAKQEIIRDVIDTYSRDN
jgi:hypothetical protein